MKRRARLIFTGAMVSWVLWCSGCAVDALSLPPEPARAPSAAATIADEFATSRPTGFEPEFAAPASGGRLEVGDRIGVGMKLTNHGAHEDWFMLVEVVPPQAVPTESRPDARSETRPEPPNDDTQVTVRASLFDAGGRRVETAVRRARRTDLATNNIAAYAELTTLARRGMGEGRGPRVTAGDPKLLERLDRFVASWHDDGASFERNQSAWLRGVKRIFSARVLSKELKARMIEAALGRISVLDAGLSLFNPPQVLVDVKRLPACIAEPSPYEAIDGLHPVVIPYAALIGGSVRCRATATFADALPPYALSGGILAADLQNAEDPEQSLAVRLLFARRAGP